MERSRLCQPQIRGLSHVALRHYSRNCLRKNVFLQGRSRRHRSDRKVQGLIAEVAAGTHSLLCGCLCSYFDRCQQLITGPGKGESSQRSQGLKAELQCAVHCVQYQCPHNQRKIRELYVPRSLQPALCVKGVRVGNKRRGRSLASSIAHV